MTMAEYCNRQIPEYYPTMYMDGYEPYQILHALHRKMIRDYEQREEAKRKAKEEADNVVIPTINFNTSIKVKWAREKNTKRSVKRNRNLR